MRRQRREDGAEARTPRSTRRSAVGVDERPERLDRRHRRRLVPIVALTSMVVLAGLAILGVVRAVEPAHVEPAGGPALVAAGLAPDPTATLSEDDAWMPSVLPILSAANGSVAWRATGGACDGASSVVEITTDGGSTWSRAPAGDTTLHEVVALTATSATTAEVLATTGPDCEVRALRTTSGGASWSEAPTSDPPPYADPQTPGGLVLHGAGITSPCPEVRQVAASQGEVLVLCSAGDAWYLDSVASFDSEPVPWVALEPPQGRAVLTIGGSPTGFAFALAGIGCMWVPAAASELPYLDLTDDCVRPLGTMPATLALASAGPDLWIEHDGVTTILPISSLH